MLILKLISGWDYTLYDDYECQLGGLNKFLIQAETIIKFSHLLLALQLDTFQSLDHFSRASYTHHKMKRFTIKLTWSQNWEKSENIIPYITQCKHAESVQGALAKDLIMKICQTEVPYWRWPWLYFMEVCAMIQITQCYDCHCQVNHWFWKKEICTW